MRCEYGYCIVCDKEIASVCPTCHRKGANQEYTEVQLKWINGSMMAMAVCVACSQDAVWKADKTEMTKAVFAAWDKLGHRYDREIVLAN